MTESRRDAGTPKARSKAAKLIGGFVVLVLVGLYTAVAPAVERRFGVDLPDLNVGQDGGIELQSANVAGSDVKNSPDDKELGSDQNVRERDKAETRAEVAISDKSDAPSKSAAPARSSRGPLAEKMRAAREKRESPAEETAKSTDAARGPPLYGYLRQIGNERYMSPGGLLYTPGSAEGHRLKHVARHTEDQPSRPGSHGVFDGGMPKTLEVIDQAYERAQKKQRTTTRREDGRVIHTVDMGRRVGYVGGRDGNQRRKPMARRIRLVLDGNRVITAFPL